MSNDLDQSQPAPAETQTTPAPDPALPLPPKPGVLDSVIFAIDRAMSAGPKRAPWEQQVWAIIYSEGGQHVVVRKSELDQIRGWEAEYQKVLAAIQAHAYPAAAREWEAHQKKLATAMHADALDGHAGKSLADFEKDHAEKVQAFNNDLKRIHDDCWEVCNFVGQRTVALIEKRIKGMSESEVFWHRHYGVTYPGESALLKAFRKLALIVTARTETNPYNNLGPSSMVGFLDL
jgi:hypothetical protein